MNKPRLIDANALKDIITGSEEFIDWQKKEICECIDCCDIAYNLNGVVEQLEKESYDSCHIDLNTPINRTWQIIDLDKAIEIVKGGQND